MQQVSQGQDGLSLPFRLLQQVSPRQHNTSKDDYAYDATFSVTDGGHMAVSCCMCVCVMQVVHSRTFGTAAKEGGTAVHMLLPLVDFLNHGGDETECFPGDLFAPTANVRWAVSFCSLSCLCLLLLLLPVNQSESWEDDYQSAPLGTPLASLPMLDVCPLALSHLVVLFFWLM